MRSKLFILLSLVFLCLIFASGGCGGGGDSGDGNNGWVTIEYPTVEKEYTISTDAINLRGEVFYFGGKCCQGSAEQLTGVTVT